MTTRRRFILFAALCVTILAALFAPGWWDETDDRVPMPLPALPVGAIELRVAYVVNERLPQPTAEQFQALLDTAKQMARAQFGVEVRFAPAEVHGIDAYFMRMQPDAHAAVQPWIFDFKNGRGNRSALTRAVREDLKKSGDSLDAMIAFAQPYLLEKMREKSYGALADALVVTQLARLDALSRELAADGRPLIDERPYNEILYWDNMTYVWWPYDVTVTNQLLASAEYGNNSVHSALRGGISNGVTTRNPRSTLGSTAIVSFYPFIGTDAVTKRLRGNETYSADEAARFAGLLLAHELGHQLLHLGHPYGQTACVMNPTPLLHFRRWAEQLAPEKCPIAESGPMKPGFTKFYTQSAQN